MPAATHRPRGRLRVLHLTTRFGPEATGGVEAYVRGLVERLCDLGHEARVLCVDPVGAPGQGVRAARPVLPFHQAVEGALSPDLEAALAAESPDLVHVHHWHQIGDGLVAAAGRAGLPAVCTLHDFFPYCPFFFRFREGRLCAPDVPLAECAECASGPAGLPASRLAPALAARERRFRRELSLAAERFVLSRAQAEHLALLPAARGIAFRVLEPPPPAVDPPPEDTPRRAPPPYCLVSWGGLVPGKGMHLLVEAAARLSVPVEIHHYGPRIDEEYAAALERRSARPLRLHGRVDRATLHRGALAADLAVFPSLFLETHGFAVDEALALGVPVVVPDRGAPRERIGGRGVTFRAGDAADLARVLAETLDPSRLAALRRGAPRPSATWERHLEALLQTYRRAVAAGPSRV